VSTAENELGSTGTSKVDASAGELMGERLGGMVDRGDVPHDSAEMTS
jgi:hypothetical protein